MKKVLKRVLCLLAVLVLVFGMTACGKPSVAEYVEKNGGQMEEVLEKQLSSMGMEWSCDVEARGNKIVVVMKSSMLDGLDDSVKKTLQETYDAQKDELKGLVSIGDGEVKDLEGVVYEVCDSKGEIVADVDIDF